MLINVLDYGADDTGTTDSTSAFASANAVSVATGLLLYAPAGQYLLDEWAPLNHTKFRGAGFGHLDGNTRLLQAAPGNPAISLVTTGSVHFIGLDFDGFEVVGHASSTTCAVLFQTSGSLAFWRSRFRFAISNSFQPFFIDSNPGTNFFNNEIEIHSGGHVEHPEITSGTYNRYRLFISDCGDSVALVHGGVNDKFEHFVSDGQLRSTGLNTVFVSPSVENLAGTSLPVGAACIDLSNSRDATLINPTVILPLGSAAKCSYAFTPGAQSTFVSPFVQSFGEDQLADPFSIAEPQNAGINWTVIGGTSYCQNKLEQVYDGSSDNTSLRNIHMLGDVSSLTDSVPTDGGRLPDYLAPTGIFSHNLNPNTDVLIVEPSGTLASAQFNIMLGLVTGRVITVTTSQILTAISWVSTANTSLLPTTLPAGGRVSFVLRANKFYPI